MLRTVWRTPEVSAVLSLKKRSTGRDGSDLASRPAQERRGDLRLTGLTVAAIGVVYGDIGTSPLYTLREAFGARGGLPLGEEAVLGVLSLIFWALLLVVTIKYVAVIMRADNQGEGGVLALVSLVVRGLDTAAARQRVAVALAMIGAALFYGDGILTPAISVLGALEGLKVATPGFEPYVVPAAVAILTGLFLLQRRGTGGVGVLFGPVMCLWFAVLAVLGVAQIAANPSVLSALNPLHALLLFDTHRWQAFVALGAVVLAVTGAEALYTDMGHFGRTPIRLAWLGFVLPALLLNYFGQGALLLRDPAALANPFYHLAPPWALYPLVVLATAATIIASQAVISGAFSLSRQAVQLGYLPRLEIRHTSERQIGQVYLPRVNWLLMAGVVAVVIGFGSSSALAGAYGIAVVGAMIIDGILAFAVALLLWRWRPWLAGLAFAGFLAVDLAFLGASATKMLQGGWFPILLAFLILLLMSTWRRGRRAVFDRLYGRAPLLPAFLASIKQRPPARVPGTAVFLTNNLDVVPRALLHNLKHNQVLHERIVTLRVVTEDVPRVGEPERVRVEHLGGNVHRVLVRYGFMESPDVPAALLACQLGPPEPCLMDTSFFLSRETYLPSGRPDLPPWREQLFIHLANGALDATRFFRLPPDRVVEIGSQVEI
jgi:KUP system potassium uptake protein